MAKKRSQKDRDLNLLHEEFLRVSSLVLSTFQGLTVEQDTELRRAIESAGGKYRVVKNTLAERAAQDTPAAPLLTNLKGVNAVAYTAGDGVALAKVLNRYAKDNPAFRFQAGLVEGRVLSLEQFQTLAALPTREELLGRLAGLLQAPAQRLAMWLGQPARQIAILLGQGVKEEKFSQVD